MAEWLVFVRSIVLIFKLVFSSGIQNGQWLLLWLFLSAFQCAAIDLQFYSNE